MDAASRAVAQLWPGRSATILELGGGITNRNYRIDVDGASYVLRMGGARTEVLGIDREAEHAASLRAHEVGVGPEVIAFVPSQGWLVARFIDGRSIAPEAMRDPPTLGRVAQAMRRFHSAAAIPGRFDAHEVVDDYRSKAEAFGVAVPAEFGPAREVSERIRAVRGRQKTVPCHNDLLNANFLDDGEVRIVDWEYAGMGDVFFDLANFSVNHDFSVDDDRRWLEVYFGTVKAEDLAALRLMRFMSDFREAMWGVLQSGISELDFDFKGYAARHFDRMLASAAQTEFEEFMRAGR
ncbi:MAG TPA: phosphotransferase [Candidatus Dormibacteraeota bacterium]